jgi:hypothetical protein
MATIDRVRDPIISQYYDNSVLLDTALSVDGFLEDVAMIYPYKNWFDGEIVAGPSVKRYWVTIILKYDYDEMPDPAAAKILTNLGCKVFYKKFKQKVEVDVKGPQDLDLRKRPKTTVEPCWLIKIVIPKKFIENEEIKGMDQLDDEVDVDQIEDSLNSGSKDTSKESGIEADTGPNPETGSPSTTVAAPGQAGNVNNTAENPLA